MEIDDDAKRVCREVEPGVWRIHTPVCRSWDDLTSFCSLAIYRLENRIDGGWHSLGSGEGVLKMCENTFKGEP